VKGEEEEEPRTLSVLESKYVQCSCEWQSPSASVGIKWPPFIHTKIIVSTSKII
jgi:hypothetical protein